MTIELTPELGVPLPPNIDMLDLRQRAEAMFQSILLLEQHGLDTQGGSEDAQAAAALTRAYAEDPQKASKLVNTERASSLTPASLRHLRNYLDEYGNAVVTHAIEVRHLVTNRLLEESQNPDPRIRIRALELLGKHSDVGLFSERSEVTVTHQTTDELKQKLRAKLQKLVRKTQAEDSDVQDVEEKSGETVAVGGDIIDLDAELGLPPSKPAFDPTETENSTEIRGKAAKNPEIFVPSHDIDPENPDGGPF